MERYVAKLKKEARLPNHCYFCCGGQLARPDTFYNNSGSNPANVNFSGDPVRVVGKDLGLVRVRDRIPGLCSTSRLG